MAWFLGQARDSGMKPMPRRKRLFDVTLALMLMIPLSVVLAVSLCWLPRHFGFRPPCMFEDF